MFSVLSVVKNYEAYQLRTSVLSVVDPSKRTNGSKGRTGVVLRLWTFELNLLYINNLQVTIYNSRSIAPPRPRYKTIIFVHGCFWHRHEGCNQATTPKTRTEFWQELRSSKVLKCESSKVEKVCPSSCRKLYCVAARRVLNLGPTEI